MSKIQNFKAISFDCYGTLIDWETGILAVLRPWIKSQGKNIDDDKILEAYGHFESEEQAEVQSAPYPEILEGVHIALAREFKIKSSKQWREEFMACVGKWNAFDDTIAALKSLQKNYKLIILSNVDNASFAETNKRLNITFDAVYTAEDICTYKPQKNNFRYLLKHAKDDLGLDKKDILHTAQSLFHDHATAQAMGMKTCWIDRRGEGTSDATGGATPALGKPIKPHWTFPNMANFAEAMDK